MYYNTIVTKELDTTDQSLCMQSIIKTINVFLSASEFCRVICLTETFIHFVYSDYKAAALASGGANRTGYRTLAPRYSARRDCVQILDISS